MARGEIPYVVTKVQGAVSGAVADYAVSGASILVNIRGGGPATVYAAETGGTTLANPLTSTAEGRIDGWLEEGSYDLVVSGAGITTYTQYIEVLRGDGTSKLAANAVTTAAIASGAVTFAKLAADVATNLIPSGTVWAFAGSSLPSGWLWCDGKLYDGTVGTYTALWNALGTTFGGTAQSSFAVPDLRGRAPVGADSLGTNGAAGRLTSNGARGNSGGAETHTLTTAQLPVHSHSISDPGHSHSAGTGGAGSHAHGLSGTFGFAGAVFGGGSWGVFTGTQANMLHVSATDAVGNHTHTVTVNSAGTGISVGNAGSGSSHNNMQPYQVFNYIIKL